MRFPGTTHLVALASVSLGVACAPVAGTPFAAPSDDPAAWDVATGVRYTPKLGAPTWLVPSRSLPDAIEVQISNNNVDIELFGDRLFMAWRTGPTHWASSRTTMHVVSSRNGGVSWDHELTVDLDTDLREPRLVQMHGELQLLFFEAGDNMFAFEPRALWRSFRRGSAQWTALEEWGEAGEVPWDVKVRGGVAYLTTYKGNHYQTGPSDISVRFYRSDDARSWRPVGERAEVYRGGCSEAAIEFMSDGSLWAVLRNEDGDATGFGSLLCRAPANDLGHWDCARRSDPRRYDSPELIRHGDSLYLLARRDVGGHYDQGPSKISVSERRLTNMIDYWNRPKRTALYLVDTAQRRVRWLQDLPSAGDTAFPSARRLDTHTFLVANYTSPVDDLDRSWLRGQGADDGTDIYALLLHFESP
ncbi:MAG: sialidase family protein [Pseudomonadota bacterium]